MNIYNKILNKIMYIGFKGEMGNINNAKSDLSANVIL